jgi:UDP-N-acetylenolpyruvoylglucosamine reductase
MSVGGARLCESKPNRIRTNRGTRSREVLELIQSSRDRVAERSGVELETALSFVDDQGRQIDP